MEDGIMNRIDTRLITLALIALVASSVMILATTVCSEESDALPGGPVEYEINVEVGESVEIGGDDFGISAGVNNGFLEVHFTWITSHPSWMTGDRYHISGTPTEAGTYYVNVQYGVYGPAYGPGINNYSGSTITIVVTDSDAPAVTERTMWLYYDLNGSSSPGFSNQSWTGTTDASFRLTDTEPVRNGYEFAGWARTADAAEAEWQPGDTITFHMVVHSEFTQCG